MFYRPTHSETGEMWDTWLTWRDGIYYLYYLAKSGDQWDNISMATSSDGLRWEELGPILRKGEGVTWMGTGSTWEAPQTGGGARFQMNFSEWKGPRQTIFFAESDDLVHWRRLDAIEFVQDERWYQRWGRWDCIWTLPRPEGGLYGYWTASPEPGTGGRFGFGQSDDGVHWEALPPPKVHGAGEGEVGAIERIAGRTYMMFGIYPTMVTLVADQPDGPFHVSSVNRDLLGGHTYFSRFFPAPGGMLVNHHAIARDGRIYMGLLKQAVVDEAGTLRLGWWQGNEKLVACRSAIDVPPGGAPGLQVSMLPQTFDMSRGLLLEARLVLPPTPFAARRGIFIEVADDGGTAVLFDAQGRAEFSRTNRVGSFCEVEKRVDREMTFDQPAFLRLVVEHALVELYLDDLLIECFSLSAPATGCFGLIQGGDPRAVSDLVVAPGEP
jgi:hypothetical protein